MDIKRRKFLQSMGMAGAGMFLINPVLGAFGEKSVSDNDKEKGKMPLKQGKGKNKDSRDIGIWYPTTCQGCTSWCPIEVLVQGGRAVKTRGNQNSQISPGQTCPRGQLILQETYDPDRLRTPMKRTNASKGKGIDPQFVPITWAAAMTEIAQKILTLRNGGEIHKLVYLRGRYTHETDIQYSAMTKILGTPNKYSHSVLCAEAEKMGPLFTENKAHYRDYDLDNCKYLLIWGTDPTRANRQVPNLIKKLSNIQKVNNGQIAVVDPCFSTSAAKADKWLPIKPGTDGALASAIAHVILTSSTYHKPFVGDWNVGQGPFVAGVNGVLEADFTEVHTYGLVKWWNAELFDKTPAWAAGITGIPAADIIKIAQDMAMAAPNVSVWHGPGAAMQPRGCYSAMGIYALNGLLGSWQNVGGPLRSPSAAGIATYPSVTAYEDAIAVAGLAMASHNIFSGDLNHLGLTDAGIGKAALTNNFPDNVLTGTPYDVKMVIGNYCNFVHSGTGAERWEAAMAMIPYFVHISTHASEMSMFADIVLPAANGTTERWSFLNTSYNKRTETSILQPVSTRLFDVRGDQDEISYMLAQELAVQGFPNLLNYYNTEFKDPDTATSPTTYQEFAEFSTKFFTAGAYNTIGGWPAFKALGVKTNNPPANFANWGTTGNTGGAGGKFEFYSTKLKGYLTTQSTAKGVTIDALMTALNYTALGELAFVPHYEAPDTSLITGTYPLQFIDRKSRFNREGRSQNLPFYYQFKKLDVGDENWADVLLINPIDATALGVVTGQTITIKSSNNPTIGITCKAKVWEGVRPGTVAKSYGQGHWAYGRFASTIFGSTPNGGSNNLVIPENSERISGGMARYGGFIGVQVQ